MILTMYDAFVKILTGPCRVRKGDAVLVCCSGGMDSMVLLDLILHAAADLDLKPGVIHVDHGIRGDASSNDALFVSRHCSALGIPCHVERLGLSPDMPNLEEHARIARYEAVFSCMREHGYHCAATGHTRDDQAETLIYRIIRGSGIRGLAGMSHRGPKELIRPLLDFTRKQIETHAASRRIMHSEDSTNLDTTLARNLIRREIIPAMQRINPSVTAAVARLADIAREEGEVVDIMSRILESDSQVIDWGMVRIFRLEEIENAPLAVLKRLIIRIVSAMLGEPRGFDSLQVEGIMEVIRREKAGHTIRRRVRAMLDEDCLAFVPAGQGPYYDIPVDSPGIYTLSPLSAKVKIDFNSEVPLPLRITSPLAGDRFEGRKVVKLLADRDVMKSLRPFWPVIVSGNRIVSIAGLYDGEGDRIIRTAFPL